MGLVHDVREECLRLLGDGGIASSHEADELHGKHHPRQCIRKSRRVPRRHDEVPSGLEEVDDGPAPFPVVLLLALDAGHEGVCQELRRDDGTHLLAGGALLAHGARRKIPAQDALWALATKGQDGGRCGLVRFACVHAAGFLYDVRLSYTMCVSGRFRMEGASFNTRTFRLLLTLLLRFAREGRCPCARCSS